MSEKEESTDKFKSRADSIFGCLDSLEKKHIENVSEYDENIKTIPVTEDETNITASHVKDKNECQFRAPQPIKRRQYHSKKTADHVLHPGKWTKYSLRNDGTKSIGKGLSADQINQKIAVDFIKDLKQRKIESNNINTEASICDHNTKISFQKPSFDTEAIENNSITAASFGSSHSGKARVMQTYEIGKQKSKNRIKDNTIIASSEKFKVDLPFEDVSENCDDIESHSDVTSTFVGRKKNSRRGIRKREVGDEDDVE